MHSSFHPSFQLSFHPCMQYCLITAGVRAPLLLLMMMPSFLSLLSDDLQTLFLSFWLDVRSLSNLDVAISCHRLRPCWMTLLQCLRSPAVDDWGQSLVTDVAIKARDPCQASANKDGHLASTCMYIAYGYNRCRHSWPARLQ